MAIYSLTSGLRVLKVFKINDYFFTFNWTQKTKILQSSLLAYSIVYLAYCFSSSLSKFSWHNEYLPKILSSQSLIQVKEDY